MLKSDQALWERELADHMAQFCDDPMIRHAMTEPPERKRGWNTWTTALLLWTPVAVVGVTVGWSIGWYVI